MKVENEYYHVSYGFHKFAWFHCDDAAAKRVMVVQLVNMGVKKTQIALAFNVKRPSIYLWKERYDAEGIEGVVSIAKGPESKFTEAIKDYIWALYKKLNTEIGYKDKIVEEVKALYEVEISREGIRRVVNEKKAREEAAVLVEKKEPVEVLEEPVTGKKPIWVKHGGALLALALLAKYGIEKLLFEGVKRRKGRYGFKECVLSLLLLLGPRLVKVEENIKLYDDEMMGGLIGRKRLPSVKTVRLVIADGCGQIGENVEEMKKEYAVRCLDLWGYKGPFYIDGHFMPYTGEERILYGYNPQRRLAEKGRTAYVVNTAGGRPIYEVLSDGFDDFKAINEKIVDFLIDVGVKRPTVIFDRGGFGWESFERIEGKADFICWYEGKVAIPKKGKWKEVRVPHASNTYGELEYVEQQYKQQVISEADEKGQGYRRIVLIKKAKKVSPAITNMKEPTGKEVLLQLVRRWGAQENVFKELVIDGYDKIHSYRKYEYGDEYFESEGIDINRMMENPQRRKLLNEKRKLENKRNVTLGRIAKREKESGKTIKATKKQQERFDEIEQRLAEISKSLEYLPEKVLRIDYINGNGLVRLSNEKKKYFDLLNLIAYNLRQDMIEIAGPVYRNNRDVHQLVLKILRLTTTVENEGSQTKVDFTQKLKGKERKSLEEICRYASSVGHSTELFPGKLSFGVN
ncbi:MAG: helix-turn-helix domain-containing protein [Nitrospinaceae bacterium]|nr:helix-turn-helix domain-containing protein [Nitrospinaceae bacterium]